MACCALEEDFIFKLAETRVDYFHCGIDFEQLLLPLKKRRVASYRYTAEKREEINVPAL